MYTLKLDHYKFEVGIEVGIEFFLVEPFLIWERGGGGNVHGLSKISILVRK